MHDDFIRFANTMRNEYLLKTEALFVSQKQKWGNAFRDNFCATCAEIAKLQDELALPAISNMEYTMLYTNFVNRRYFSEIWVYGDMRCLGKNQRMVGEYDISFLFNYFDELWDKLLSTRKRYVGKVSAREVTAFMLQAIPDFYSYLIKIARFSIAGRVDKEPYTDIAKNEVFRVNVGDYMAKTESVFIEKNNKDAGELTERFSELQEVDFMRYYVMEPAGNLLLPAASKGEDAEVVIASDLSRFSEFDYDARSELISEALKSLMELYMRRYDFKPVVYWDIAKEEQAIFWRFKPPFYEDYQATYRNDGIVSHISFPSNNAPIAFTARSPKGVCSIVVKMAVAESALRRSILGLNFTKLLKQKEV